MIGRLKKQAALWGAALAVGAAAMASTTAQAAMDFSGQRVTVIIPFRAGGGTDLYGRMIGEALVKRLPGSPQVGFHNVAGAGSTLGANLFQRQARPDGRTLLILSASTQLAAMLGDPRVEYDIAKWTPLLATPTGGAVQVRADLKLNTVKELRAAKTPLKFASQPATSLDLVMLLGAKVLDLPLQPMFGYRGRGDGRIALEKGEAQIDYQTTSAYLGKSQSLVADGTAVPLFSFGALGPDGSIVRDPAFAKMPTIVEAYQATHGGPPSGPAFDAFKAVFAAVFTVQKAVMLPEGVSEELVQTYRAAVAEMLKDPEFIAKAQAELGGYTQMTGDDAAKALKTAAQMPPEARKWVLDWLKSSYDLKFED